MKKNAFIRAGLSLLRFLMFFAFCALVLTSGVLLILRSMPIERSILEPNAKYAFINIIFLTLVFWTADMIRKNFTVAKPVRRIIDGLDRITAGDFNVHIEETGGLPHMNQFNVIIERINKMTTELGSVETLRTDFISNVSHELKTPLSAINNYGTLLQSPDLPEEDRVAYAKAVTENSRRLADLITNILKLNKLENQQIFSGPEPYNLSEQLCECLLSFEAAWEEKLLDIETDIEDDVIICADGELLSLVWNNLFSNAVKFTEPHGRIFVGLKTDGEYAAVTVTDTGCGMSKETGGHIFEKFYQGDTSHASEGNGLGLALVKRVVDITDGELSVHSELGKGSTFTVKLRSGASDHKNTDQGRKK